MNAPRTIPEADVIRDILYRGVLERPDDDTPRLVMADWFDENGEPDRAEFCRAQCELAQPRVCPSHPGLCVACQDAPSIDLEWFRADKFYKRCADRRDLRSRERALFAAHGAEWFGMQATLLDPEALVLLDPTFVVRRGFPAHWYGPWDRWIDGGECAQCAGAGGHILIGPNIEENRGGVFQTPANAMSRANYERGASRDAYRAETETQWLSCQPCAGSGRIPGACDVLAWRSGWRMECPEKPNPKLAVDFNQQTKRLDYDEKRLHKDCPTCCGSGRVPRPIPDGALPLSEITLTTMPDREWLEQRRDQPIGVLHSTLLAAEWPGLVFNLPSDRGGEAVQSATAGRAGNTTPAV